MKHLKTFETIHKTPRIGDYVLCEEKDTSNFSLNYFISSNIGQIINNRGRHNSYYPYLVKYENVPVEIEKRFENGEREMAENEVLYWSDNKEELETIINTNKYKL